MKVAVTGSLGKIGCEAVRALKAAGHSVYGLDLRAAMTDGVRTAACDCTDFGQVMGALSGIDTLPRPDAVVHLAGIPMPGLAPDATVFGVNTTSTYNVFSAARRLGIRRLVWASSETIHGLPFTVPPEFVPIDESHPLRPEWSYSLAKKLGEDMADEFVRWCLDMTVVSLRFSFVMDAADRAAHCAAPVDLDRRKANLWSYVDARDAGEACRLAVEAELHGHHRYIIAGRDSIVTTPSRDLMAQYFPDTPILGEFVGTAPFLSSSAAERDLGYLPQHDWREP